MINTEVIYLGHSSWIVKTESAIYVFDYADCIGNENTADLIENYISTGLIDSKKIFVMTSHDHHDHYCKRLHNNCNSSSAISLIGGININPRETKVFGDITIDTAASTDKGVCFLVTQKDGLSIFHSGDNADWGDEGDGSLYYRETDYIASKNSNVDIAFIPVCTFSGMRLESITAGALYAAKTLKPNYIFPMHGNGREYLYKDFFIEAPETVKKSMLIAEKIGQKFELQLTHK